MASAAFTQGYLAYCNGEDPPVPPPGLGKSQASEWLDGWYEARTDDWAGGTW